MKYLKYIPLYIVFLGMIGWGTLAIYYSYLPEGIRIYVSAAFVLGALGILILIRPRRRGIIIFLCLFLVVLVGWFSMTPSNNRDWQADVSVLPYATIDGDKITVHNIRNCDYRTETEYEVRHYNKTFNLSELESIDLFLVDWGLKVLVHTMISFGFEDGSYICISIETRKEKGEGYSTIKGFFRQYELTYVVADERDLVRLRTNYRKGETVYLYHLVDTSPKLRRNVFLDYMRHITRLKDHPEWYNALTGNCTTQIRGHTKPYTHNMHELYLFEELCH